MLMKPPAAKSSDPTGVSGRKRPVSYDYEGSDPYRLGPETPCLPVQNSDKTITTGSVATQIMGPNDKTSIGVGL